MTLRNEKANRKFGDGVFLLHAGAIGPAASRRSARVPFRTGRTIVAVLCFLLLFAILIVMVSQWYLLPTLAAFNVATKAEKLEIAAYARLLLTVLLVILIVGLMLTFRMGRFFFPRETGPRVKTTYIDAWAEAGKRASEADSESDES